MDADRAGPWVVPDVVAIEVLFVHPEQVADLMQERLVNPLLEFGLRRREAGMWAAIDPDLRSAGGRVVEPEGAWLSGPLFVYQHGDVAAGDVITDPAGSEAYCSSTMPANSSSSTTIIPATDNPIDLTHSRNLDVPGAPLGWRPPILNGKVSQCPRRGFRAATGS